jgi:hypothetical protein
MLVMSDERSIPAVQYAFYFFEKILGFPSVLLNPSFPYFIRPHVASSYWYFFVILNTTIQVFLVRALLKGRQFLRKS